MPKYDLKTIQKELETGKIWPVYWIYGPENWKSREVLQWIRKAVLESKEGKSEASSGLFGFGFGNEAFEAAETNSYQLLEAAQSLSLGGGIRFITVRDAHLLRDMEPLSELFGPAVQKKSELTSVCVFISKELDGRKKFSKQLLEKAAVIPCEEIGESNRETWIQYLAKRKELQLPSDFIPRLLSLDPWSLDRIEQELEKWVVAGMDRDIVSVNLNPFGEAQDFVEALFMRDLSLSLPQVSYFATQADASLPLLGLLGWHLRQLIVYVANRGQTPSSAKSNPYLAERLRRWQGKWKLSELLDLQAELAHLDYGLKQSAASPLGLWTSLVAQFCVITSKASKEDTEKQLP